LHFTELARLRRVNRVRMVIKFVGRRENGTKLAGRGFCRAGDRAIEAEDIEDLLKVQPFSNVLGLMPDLGPVEPSRFDCSRTQVSWKYAATLETDWLNTQVLIKDWSSNLTASCGLE
jgi:hypothetical protein